MPLSPECAELVERQRGVAGPDFATLAGEDAVAYVNELRAAFPVAADGVRSDVEVADRALDLGNRHLTVRTYAPRSEVALPVVAFFHGGGWVAGTPRAYDQLGAELAAITPCVVASVAYRLAPEHRFPAAFEDACAAIEWLAGNAAELNGDPRRLSVFGISAGGNLAAAAALHAREEGGPALAKQVLVYPVTDQTMGSETHREMGEGYVTTHAQIGFFWEQYAPDADLRRTPYASPLQTPDLSGLPPALVFGAEYDPLCGEGRAYAEALREAGTESSFELCAGQIHGFLSLFPESPASRTVLSLAAAELSSAG